MPMRNPGCGARSSGDYVICRPFEMGMYSQSWCYNARCVVIIASCGSGLNTGDIIDVWDTSQCYFSVPAELLFRSQVVAHKFNNRDDYGIVGTADPYPEQRTCIWHVTSMCCIENQNYTE